MMSAVSSDWMYLPLSRGPYSTSFHKRLYSGFFSFADERRLEAFHRVP